jgi:cation diffusion facilitator family transporter
MMDKRAKYGYIEGLIAIVANAALFALKYWVGVMSGSVALLADAWHTLSDSISSALLIAGIRLSVRKPDKKHPFGHGRWEQITAIFIGFILGIIAWDFMMNSIHKFQAHEAANFGTPAIIVTIISILAKEGMAQFAFFVARKTDNTAVRADGWHHRSDALSSIALLIGLMFHNRFWWIDSVLGMVIALMLFYTTFEIVRDAISKILGEEPTEELIGEVKRIVDSSTGMDVMPHHFHIHNYGKHRELTFHIKVDPAMDVRQAHCLATTIEKSLRENLNIVSTIHIEPLGVEHK